MKYLIQTFGCQMNYSDTERVASLLEEIGFEKTKSENSADFLIFNSCSVRQKAEDRVLGSMKKIRELRMKNPNLIVGVTGCMVRKSSTRNSERKDGLFRHSKDIDVTFRIEDLMNLPDLLSELNPDLKFSFSEGNLKNYFEINPKYNSKFQAFLPIMTGCNNFCAYCIVPYSRGREKSRPFYEVLYEAEKMVESGIKEITLLGQNVNSYNPEPGSMFALDNTKINDEISPLPFGKLRVGRNDINIPGNDGNFAQDDKGIGRNDINIPGNDSNFAQDDKGIGRNDSNIPGNEGNFAQDDKSIGRNDSNIPGNDDNFAQDDKSIGRNDSNIARNDNVPPFVQLLKEIDGLKAKGLDRLRFTSPHPKDMSDELIEVLGSLKTLCNYIHLPVQSGDNEVLKKMNRNYTIEHYLGLIKKIRKQVPNCAISTDIIVGFPGETEEQFNNSAKLFKEVEFDMAYMAQYSPRKGTFSADRMEDDIPKKVKVERWHKLNDILTKTSFKKNSAYKGQTVEVLVEKCVNNILSGRTRSFKEVFFQGQKDRIGKIVKVKIEEAKEWFLEGKTIK